MLCQNTTMGYLEHRFKYITFYVQKHIASMALPPDGNWDQLAWYLPSFTLIIQVLHKNCNLNMSSIHRSLNAIVHTCSVGWLIDWFETWLVGWLESFGSTHSVSSRPRNIASWIIEVIWSQKWPNSQKWCVIAIPNRKFAYFHLLTDTIGPFPM